jgi:hypothetical protein
MAKLPNRKGVDVFIFDKDIMTAQTNMFIDLIKKGGEFLKPNHGVVKSLPKNVVLDKAGTWKVAVYNSYRRGDAYISFMKRKYDKQQQQSGIVRRIMSDHIAVKYLRNGYWQFLGEEDHGYFVDGTYGNYYSTHHGFISHTYNRRYYAFNQQEAINQQEEIELENMVRLRNKHYENCKARVRRILKKKVGESSKLNKYKSLTCVGKIAKLQLLNCFEAIIFNSSYRNVILQVVNLWLNGIVVTELVNETIFACIQDDEADNEYITSKREKKKIIYDEICAIAKKKGLKGKIEMRGSLCGYYDIKIVPKGYDAKFLPKEYSIKTFSGGFSGRTPFYRLPIWLIKILGKEVE